MLHLTIGNTHISVEQVEETRVRLKTAARWMMLVPANILYSDKKLARTYAIRENYIFVYDEDGDAWMGPAAREVICHIANFGYEEKDYHVPIRGEGQKMGGDPIVIDGFTVAIYPEWLGKKSLQEDLAFWAFLEKERARYYADGRSINDEIKGLKLLGFER